MWWRQACTFWLWLPISAVRFFSDAGILYEIINLNMHSLYRLRKWPWLTHQEDLCWLLLTSPMPSLATGGLGVCIHMFIELPFGERMHVYPCIYIYIVHVLSVKIHRRVATSNTKSREAAGALAGTGPSVNGPDPGTIRCFRRCKACHLTYTQSGRCKCAFDDLPACINTCKH